jgi:release factor glutamine methyltransferase
VSVRPHVRLIDEAAGRLASVVTSPREEAGRLLAHALGLARRADLVPLFAGSGLGAGRTGDARLTPEVRARFEDLVRERASGVPLQYVLGHADFYESRFVVPRGVLIPRPETELLVDAVLRALPPGPSRVLEVGTGTGVILVSVLIERGDVTGIGTDISGAARRATEENARRLGVADRLEALEGDLFAPVPPGAFDVVVSNPPYVATHEALPPEVADHEPPEALYAGADGLAVIRRLLAESPPFLAPGGRLLVEIGATQGERVVALFGEHGFGDVTLERDLSGRDRIVGGRYPA